MTSTRAYATGSVSQAFKTTDSSLSSGTLVVQKLGSAGVVEKATSSQALQLLGVTTNNSLLALGGGVSQTQVVVSGLTPTLVSDINGTVKIGDKITASPIEGVGMKATISTEIVGTAESNLSDSTLTTESIKDNRGKTTRVKIGLVNVQVNVSYYAKQNNQTNGIVPSFLINIGDFVAGKQVSSLRVLISFFCLLAGFVIAGIMLEAGVRSGIISMGRNPLASGILRHSLVDVLLTSVGLLAITLTAFYLILAA